MSRKASFVTLLTLVLVIFSNMYYATAYSGTISIMPNSTSTMNETITEITMLNGTRMVTDSKMCLASVDRCVMVKMMHLPPKIQMEAGIGALDVACNSGFQLILKATDATPACVTPSTAAELILRGWALGQDELTKIKMMYEPNRQ